MPIPRDPPVIKTFFPATENSEDGDAMMETRNKKQEQGSYDD